MIVYIVVRTAGMASFIFPSALITGANRGLGLNIIKHILKSPTVPGHIFATCRSLKAENAKELQILAEKNSNLHLLEFDMADVSGPRLPELVKQVSDVVQESGLSLLVNNAGIIIRESFDEISAESLRNILDVNTVAPCVLISAFRPLLKRAAAVKKASEQQPHAAVVNISSIMGSIGLMNEAYQLGYKLSKAALNMVTKCVSGEFAGDGIAVVSIHPGWVQTDMGGQKAPVTINDSVSGIVKVISSLQKSQTGMFLQYDGTTLPW